MIMTLQAVIFDLDGTVLLNEKVYAGAFGDVLGKYGVGRVEQEGGHPQIHGIGLEANWVLFKKRFGGLRDLSVARLVHETQDAYHNRLGEVEVRSGFFDLHKSLVDKGVQIALATSNDWWLVGDELDDLGLHKYFNVLVTAEEVANLKPAPDIFWKAAEKLSVEPKVCVVIEDSKAGIEAAKEAGMVAVAILSSFSRPKDFPRADWVVEGFEEVTPELLDSLF